MGLWDLERNEPADPEAGPVVSALARTGDPDLAVRSLRRLIESLDRADPTGGSAAALLARLRGPAPLQNGRASWRGRGEISVVAVSLKKKQSIYTSYSSPTQPYLI